MPILSNPHQRLPWIHVHLPKVVGADFGICKLYICGKKMKSGLGIWQLCQYCQIPSNGCHGNYTKGADFFHFHIHRYRVRQNRWIFCRYLDSHQCNCENDHKYDQCISFYFKYLKAMVEQWLAFKILTLGPGDFILKSSYYWTSRICMITIHHHHRFYYDVFIYRSIVM